jgi:hypothetical protein
MVGEDARVRRQQSHAVYAGGGHELPAGRIWMKVAGQGGRFHGCGVV